MNKAFGALLLGGLWFVSFTVHMQAETVRISLISLSPQILPAEGRGDLGQTFNVSFSSTQNAVDPNHELRLADDTIPFTHQSFLVRLDPIIFEPELLAFALDVPDLGDDNGNGIADFFDRPVATPPRETEGAHPTSFPQDALMTANWRRDANEPSGTVTIDVPFFGFTSTHEYRVPRYEGEFTYTRNGSNLLGTLSLVNVLADDDRMNGPLALTITNNNSLSYEAGTWAGAGAVAYNFRPLDSLDRRGTNFVALLAFEDGYSPTGDLDYNYWFLVIHSTDANANDVLDLVEGAGVAPERPRLEIARTAESVQITVRGTPGVTYALEAADVIVPNTQWNFVQDVSLTTEIASVPIRLDFSRKFYRLRQL